MAINAGSVAETYELMRQKLGRVLPDFEIKLKAELVYEINRLKHEQGAVILGHNYMEPALFHSVPDFVGDSLELSRRAAETRADPIIFCGVKFMGETAKILNPSRTVLVPAEKAGCSLAESITADDVRRLREAYPGVPIVTYINTYADVKAECDVVCTSGNAARVVAALNSETIIFLPDEFLASNVARETGRTIIFSDGRSEKTLAAGLPSMIGWRGRCEVHERFTVEDITNVRRQFPDVAVLAHPECPPDVVLASDYSASTSKMVEFARSTTAKRLMLLTECSMADNIIAEVPDKEIVRLCSLRCPHMNEITLEMTLAALRKRQYEVTVPEETARRARRALERMLAI